LTNQLLLKYRFTKKNAETVAKAFLESSRLAGVFSTRQASHALFSPTLPSPQADIRSAPLESAATRQMLSAPSSTSFPTREENFSTCRQEIPLGPNRRATLELPDDINEEEIAKIIRVLQALA
jgi:hypothetical protein